MHDVAGGRSGGLGGEHRSLSPVSSPSTPPAVLPQPPHRPSAFPDSLRYSLRLRPFVPSLATILYFAVPSVLSLTAHLRAYLQPEFSCSFSFHRASSFSPVSPSRTSMAAVPLLSLSLFVLLFASFSFSLCASCEQTMQPNNRHRRRKPENSVTSPPPSLFHSLLFSVCLRLFVRHGDYLSPYSAARKKLDFAIPMAARENLF